MRAKVAIVAVVVSGLLGAVVVTASAAERAQVAGDAIVLTSSGDTMSQETHAGQWIAFRQPVRRVAMERAGIQVDLGCRQEAAAALNAPFLWAAARPDRPFVALKIAVSLDGFLADAEGRSQWISGDEALAYVHWLRAGFDAIAVGRRTADADDPELTARGSVTPRVPPRRVVFARSGRVREDLRLVKTAREIPTAVVTSPHLRDRTASRLASAAVQVIGTEGVAAALRELRALGVTSVLVEGGSTIAAEFLNRDLVDRLYQIQAPLWLGSGMPAFGPRDSVPLASARRWVVTERRALGRDSLLVVDRELCLAGS